MKSSKTSNAAAAPSRRRLTALLAACGLAAGIGGGLLLRPLRNDPYAQRRAAVAGLNQAEKYQLLRQKDRFAALDEDEQQRLLALHDDLQAEADHEQLQVVMVRYHEWLKELTTTQRVELAKLPPQERIEKVKEYQHEQDKDRRLGREDYERVRQWFTDHVLAKLDEEQQQRLREGERGDLVSRVVLYAFSRWRGMAPDERLSFTEEEYQELANQLSPTARRPLKDAKTLSDKRELIGRWVNPFFRHRWVRGGGGPRPVTPEVDRQELAEFFESLDPQRRDEYLQLSPQEREQQLRLHYLRQKYPERMFGFGGFGGPGGPGPGADSRPPRRGDGGRGRGGRPGQGGPDGGRGRPNEGREAT